MVSANTFWKKECLSGDPKDEWPNDLGKVIVNQNLKVFPVSSKFISKFNLKVFNLFLHFLSHHLFFLFQNVNDCIALYSYKSLTCFF